MSEVIGPAIDPRIRQRRIAVRRDEGRRRLRRLAVVAVMLSIVLIGVAIAHSPLLDVDEITVAGVRSTPAPDIIEAAGIGTGDAMVRLDVAAATDAIEALPWVDTATISRDYPGAIEIAVVERTPVAVIRRGAEAALVDASGRILGPPRADVVDLVELVVDAPIPPAGATLGVVADDALDLAADAGRVLTDHAVVATFDGDRVELVVDGAISVVLGSMERTDAKLRSAATVLAQVELACLATVDVRTPQRPVLTRESACQ